ncbi:MAG: aminotransferase, partial [bacterium]|nr:aminotransferase [bacterium]
RAKHHGLPVLGPKVAIERGAALALDVPNASEVEMLMMQKGIIVSARGAALRLAVHFFTTFEDIDITLEAIKSIMSKQIE